MIINKQDVKLANGEIISVGMNFRALELMTQYPGGLTKLQKGLVALEAADPESEEYGELLAESMRALAYMLYALIRAGGTQCTVEDCALAVGLEDIPTLQGVFAKFSETVAKMSGAKNLQRRKPSTSRG